MNSLPTIPREYQKHMQDMFSHVLPVAVRGVTQILETTQNGEVIIHVRQTAVTVEVEAKGEDGKQKGLKV